MSKGNWKAYGLWIALAEAVGALSGWVSRAGFGLYREGLLVKPPLSPPGAVFPVVWVALYALVGTGAARVALSPASRARSRALGVFALQLAFNFFWSVLFFRWQNYGLALGWIAALWGLILWMIQAFAQVEEPAAQLQLPYLIWVTFAAYLNFGVWRLNG